MTIAQMHLAFNLELKAQGSHEDFEPEEIDVFLNRAIRSFVDERKPILRVEEIALADLRTLLQTESLGGSDVADYTLFPNTVAADLTKLTKTFEYAVAARAAITQDSASKTLRFRSMEAFLDDLITEAHSPVYRRLPATIEGTTLLAAYDATDGGISAVTLTYLRPPAAVSLDASTNSDLPEHTHPQIVTQAVMLARAALFATE